jgi:1-deoxy-D-xylulose-5-phosphate reductoisomerase
MTFSFVISFSMQRKNLTILGSTGSIGKNALDIVRNVHPHLRVVALAAKSNITLLEEQVREFSPLVVAVFEQDKAQELQARIPHVKVVAGLQGLEMVARLEECDTVLAALSGTIGITPTIAALEEGKRVALANKEVLVSAGAYVMQLVAKKGVTLLPIDSEHSAIFQCLEGRDPASVRRIILTASGGPFLHHSLENLVDISAEMALNHPTWRMGVKNTIDSSTLMNKGLEVIEARWLFGIPSDKIEVVIHPQSVIHSMVEFIDGSIIAQMSQPDMRLPIQYALTYPKKLPGRLPPFNFTQCPRLDFFPVDMQKFRCLPLAYEALQRQGSLPCYLNAANEVLVTRFYEGKIGWLDIAAKLERLMRVHSVRSADSVQDILAIDKLARTEAAII